MVKVEVDDREVRTALERLARSVGNPQPALQKIGAAIVNRAKDRFNSRIGADGQQWLPKKTPNKYSTLRGESGDLARQFTMAVTGATLTVGNTTRYAAIHQFGGTIQRAARQVSVSHRTDAKGELLRRAIGNRLGPDGKPAKWALVFAKPKHERQITRSFPVAAHGITIPPRPFLPVRQDGTLYPDEQRLILAEIEAWLAKRAEGSAKG